MRRIDRTAEARVFTALNHRARRAARRERRGGVRPELRMYEPRPSWQRRQDRVRLVIAPETTLAPDSPAAWRDLNPGALRVLDFDPIGRTVTIQAPPHVDMPWCARCGRPVEGMISWDAIAPFEVNCHGDKTIVMRAADGELPAGLVLFGRES